MIIWSTPIGTGIYFNAMGEKKYIYIYYEKSSTISDNLIIISLLL